MLNVTNKYFHGLSFNCWYDVGNLTNLDLFSDVLNDKMLLTRTSLMKRHPDYYGKLFGYSGNEKSRISVCCHPTKYQDYIKKFSIGCSFFEDYDNSFSVFVSNCISVILDSNLLDKHSYVAQGMLGEFQIVGNISLKNMVGVGVPNYFERIIQVVSDCLDGEECTFSKSHIDYYVRTLEKCRDVDSFLENGFDNNGYKRYEIIKEMLKEYGYDVPVVDSETGKEWSSKELIGDKVTEIRDKALRKKLIRL